MENNQYLLETQGYLYIVTWQNECYSRLNTTKEKPMAKIFGNKASAERWWNELKKKKFITSITTFKILKDGTKESITMEMEQIGL